MSVVVARLTRSDDRWTLLGLAAVLAGSLWAFGLVTEDYLTNDPLVQWDVRFARWLHEHSSDTLVSLFKVLTFAGNSIVLLVLVGVLVVAFARRGRPNDGAVLVLALGGAAVVNALLKLLFHRARPEVAFVHLETYSFPSGHAAAATATFSTLAFVIGRRSAPRRAIAAALAALFLVVLVGFSRLYLGVHYLSDVMAGTAFGLSWACSCLIAYVLYGDRSLRQLVGRPSAAAPERREPLSPGAALRRGSCRSSPGRSERPPEDRA